MVVLCCSCCFFKVCAFVLVSAAWARESGGNGWQNVQAGFTKTGFFWGQTVV